MVKIRAIQVRTTRGQYDRITTNARTKGFLNLSSYLRYMALDRDAAVEQKVREIHEHLLGDQTDRKKPARRNRESHKQR